MKMRTSSAFTLIELMVVIAIIGILTAVIMANFATAKSKGRDAKRVSDVSQLQLAITGYFDRCGVYPATIADLNTTNNAFCPSGVTLGTFISTIPTPPSGAVAYYYAYGYAFGDDTLKTPIDYILGATLENNLGSSGNGLTAFPVNGTTAGSVKYVVVSPASGSFTCDTAKNYCSGPR